MATAELCLQTETETFLTGASALEGERYTTPPLNLEPLQCGISRVVTSIISRASHDLVLPEERSAVIQDVTQDTWIKLLPRINSPEVKTPASYTAKAAKSVSLDELRRRKRKRTLSLPLDHDGELSQGKVLLTAHLGMRDPAVEYELKEFLTEIIEAVAHLPFKQMYGMICEMKEKVGDMFPLAEMFMKHGIDITSIDWPQDQQEVQRLRSLISVARKTLREKFNRAF